MTTLTLPAALPRGRTAHRGAHRKPFPLTTTVIWGTATVVCAGILTTGVLAITAPRPMCHTEPMHTGWPNSHCHLTWRKWKQP